MNFNDLLSEVLTPPSPHNGQKLTKEEKVRTDFRAWLNGDVKAEFINREIVMHLPAK
ncbi:MAG: hypothetical protein ACI9LN_000548 [Saprospiraceae bacterium]|jgi:hypothetical protein